MEHAQSFGAYTRQYRAAHDDLRRARAIQPKNDGSKQWRLAHRYASCVGHIVKYENRAVEDARAHKRGGLEQGLRGFKTWVRRVQSAHNAYFAYVYSGNWAGYCAIGRRFTSVTATWTQPQVHVEWEPPRERSTSGSVSTAGLGQPHMRTDRHRYRTEWQRPGADYSAWYEMLPKPPVTIAMADTLRGTQDMVVNAGDTVTATVTSLGDQRFRLTLADNTQGETFSIIKTSRAAKCDSAEIIVESHLGHGMGLADFDPVHFTKCAVDGRPITSFHWKKINITAIGNLVMTSTSALGADGSQLHGDAPMRTAWSGGSGLPVDGRKPARGRRQPRF